MLKRKLLRDLRIGKAQFLSIFLMCFLGMFIYCGIYGEWCGMQVEMDSFYENTNLSDVWIQGNQVSKQTLEKVEGVEEVNERTLLIGSDSKVSESVLQCYITNEVTISKLQIVQGQAYDESVDGIWLDALYARENKLEVGSIMDIEIGELKIQKPIVGLAYHPEYVYAMKDDSAMMPDHKTFAFVYIPAQSVPTLADIGSNQILVKTQEDITEMKARIKGAYGQNVQVITNDEHPSVQMLNSEIEQHKAIGTIFPIMFLMIAILTTLNTMSKLVANQRIQIGTLKALGFQRKTLYVHYMSHTLLIAISGSILGSVTGPLLIPDLIYALQESMFTLPNWQAHMDFQVVYMLFITIVLCVIACYVAIHKTLREQAASIMRPKTISITQRMQYQNRSLWKRLNFYTQWNLRDIIRNKARSFMAIVGITGCCALLIASLGLMDSINKMIDDMYVNQHTYASKLTLAQAQKEEIDALKQEVNGSLALESIASFQFNQEEISVPLTVLEDTTYIKLDQKNTSLPEDGFVISEKLARQYDIQVGDVLNWKTYADATWRQDEVVMLAYTPLGQGITMKTNVYEAAGYQFQPSCIFSDKTSIDNQAIVQSVQYREDLYRDMDTMLEAMQVLVAVLILSAVILGMVVLYNCTSLSFFERTREMATLKVLGFSEHKIQRLTRSQNLQLCIISVLFSIPFGYIMIYFMSSTLSESMDMRAYVSLPSLVISIAFTFVITIAISMWMARKSRNIDMVSALKSTE